MYIILEDMLQGEKGKRYVLPPLTLERRTHYERTLFHETQHIVWRYQFRTDKGQLVIYSGVWLFGLELEQRYRIRATIKRQEPEWNCTRIMRPVIVPATEDQPGLDFLR